MTATRFFTDLMIEHAKWRSIAEHFAWVEEEARDEQYQYVYIAQLKEWKELRLDRPGATLRRTLALESPEDSIPTVRFEAHSTDMIGLVNFVQPPHNPIRWIAEFDADIYGPMRPHPQGCFWVEPPHSLLATLNVGVKGSKTVTIGPDPVHRSPVRGEDAVIFSERLNSCLGVTENEFIVLFEGCFKGWTDELLDRFESLPERRPTP